MDGGTWMCVGVRMSGCVDARGLGNMFKGIESHTNESNTQGCDVSLVVAPEMDGETSVGV